MCAGERAVCTGELHGNGDLCAGRGSVRRLESATADSAGWRAFVGRAVTSSGCFQRTVPMSNKTYRQRKSQFNPRRRRALSEMALLHLERADLRAEL